MRNQINKQYKEAHGVVTEDQSVLISVSQVRSIEARLQLMEFNHSKLFR